MPAQIDDLSALDPQTKEIEVPLSATDPSLGCVHVTVRELPYAVKASTEMRFMAASRALYDGSDTFSRLSKGEPVPGAQLDEMGAALGSLRAAQLEVIRWGVVGHRAADFVSRDQIIDFTSEAKLCAGVSFDVASARMLRLYGLLSASGLLTASTGLVATLCQAVLDFQNGVVRTPAEVWGQTKKKATTSPAASASPSSLGSDSASSLAPPLKAKRNRPPSASRRTTKSSTAAAIPVASTGTESPPS